MTKITYQNPETGEVISKTLDISKEKLQQIEEETKPILEEDKLQQLIDNIDISAELKILLDKVRTFTVKIGEKVIQIGRKVIEFLIAVYLKYPNTVKGALIGAILGFLLTQIPMIGFIFSWAIPLLALIGGIKGFLEDSHGAIIDNIKKLINEMFKAWKDLK